jgi:hypothetical protein
MVGQRQTQRLSFVQDARSEAEVGEKRLDEWKAGMRLETQCGKHLSGVKRFAERDSSRGVGRV